jgi:hypothetical protein
LAASENVDGFAMVQNIFEYTSATINPMIRVSGDSATGTTSHIVLHHNTCVGFFTNGRLNLFYDDGATARAHKMMSVKGNIFGQINHKGDVFDSDGTRLGGWPFEFGVGCEGSFSLYIDAQSSGVGGSFAQDYPGLRASLGTSSSIMNSPLFVAYAGTTSGPAGGTGNGNYRLSSGSPADGRVASVLRFDLDGNARSASLATSGAYEL